MNLRRILTLLCIGILLVAIDVMWIVPIPDLRLLVNLSLVTVIVFTLSQNIIVGLMFAALVGYIYMMLSAVTGWGYPLAFCLAALSSWLFSRRIVTSRSTISFITTVIVGTVVYGLTVYLADLVLNVFNHERLHLQATIIVVTTAVQCVFHPILLSGLWRFLGRDQYHRVVSSVQQSF
jgi:hypothetical protein